MAKEVAELKEEAQNLRQINLRSETLFFSLQFCVTYEVLFLPHQDYFLDIIA